MSFQAGEVVQLKSGGPAMIVTGDSPEGVHCLWYGEANDDIKTSIIPAICLEALELDDEEDDDEDDHPKHKKHKHD